MHSIVNTVPVLHVSFLPPGSPVPTILPMIGRMGLFSSPSSDIDEALDLYLHGYVSARLFRANLPVCVAATIVDGIVLSLLVPPAPRRYLANPTPSQNPLQP